jgi:RNA polymerase sigma factor (sigma-70 family)
MAVADQDELSSLLSAVGRRDRAAFKRLYESSSPKLFGIVLRIVKDRASAEEVLQDVYLRIWEHADTYAAEVGSAWAWINAIARNRAIDVVRQRTAVALPEPNEGLDWFKRIAERRDREAEVINNASLRACLERIDTQARDCVLLAYYEGFSREELAERYAAPVNTIKTWLHRSLANLRACLDGGSA